MTKILARVAALFKLLERMASLLAAALFGRWSWQAPPWIARARSVTNRAFRYWATIRCTPSG